MTCNRDCAKCIYSVMIIRRKCRNPNSTCDGECYKCIFSDNKDIRYICNKRSIKHKGVNI